MRDDDRFTHSLPSFKAPNEKENLGVLVPPRPRYIPSSVAMKDRRDNDNVQRLLEQAKTLSGKIVEEFPLTTSKPVAKIKPIKMTFTAAHQMSDEQFIKTTRTMNITDKGAVSLLLANGGRVFLESGMLLAQAWDALRKEKMARLAPAPDKRSDKRHSVEGESYTPGTPTIEERMRKANMTIIK